VKTNRFAALAAATLFSIPLSPVLSIAGCPLEALLGCHTNTSATKAENIVETASAAGKFKILLAAAQAAGLAETLKGEGPFTVFAPSDEAFAKLPKGTVESLLKPENKDKLAAILRYHVVPGSIRLTKALEAGQGKTVLGPSLGIKFADGHVKIGTANLVNADITASNGVIHVIDSVLLPPATEFASGPSKARKLITLAIDRGVPLFNAGDPDACKAIYEVTAEALLLIPDPSLSTASREKLTTALAKVREQTTAREQAWMLRRALDEVNDGLEETDTMRTAAEQFQPIKEAEMPQGFPGYTPVGQIEVKNYPMYRKATASGMAEFWRLFNHIKQNHVAMTAPVEMDYGDPRSQKLAERSMSFLYGKPDQGTPGKQGSVVVSDVLPTPVVSIGCRGSRTSKSIAEARAKLIEYLVEHKNEYTIAGPVRVMGYNSPFVPSDKNFFEVQVPIKVVKAE
jgi:uncharacterized surface protein with fasciclin (FAS1) repeats